MFPPQSATVVSEFISICVGCLGADADGGLRFRLRLPFADFVEVRTTSEDCPIPPDVGFASFFAAAAMAGWVEVRLVKSRMAASHSLNGAKDAFISSTLRASLAVHSLTARAVSDIVDFGCASSIARLSPGRSTSRNAVRRLAASRSTGLRKPAGATMLLAVTSVQAEEFEELQSRS